MRYKKTKKEETIEILEILNKEGIDTGKIAPRRKQNGERVFITLGDIKDERIRDIIQRYNLDSNFNIGQQIKSFRTKADSLTEVERKRIEKLGIKKQDDSLEQKTKPFRNQIEEAIYILEKLQQEGIDIAFISKRKDGKFIKLRDINAPQILAILERLGLDPDYPIGYKLDIISREYIGQKGDYHFGEQERQRVEQLGIFNSLASKHIQTLDILEKLKKAGIDISTAKQEVETGEGKTRGRYICELEDENIEGVLKQLNLPKYYLIGDRVKQIYIISNNERVSATKRDEMKSRLQGLFERKKRTEIDIVKTLELFKLLERKGINTAAISATKGKEQNSTRLEDLELENINQILRKLNIQKDFSIGKAINRIVLLYNDRRYLTYPGLTEKNKKQIEKYCIERQKEKEKTVVKETIALVKRIEEYGIDIRKQPLRPMKDGKQTSLLLSDLPLTEEQLQEVKEKFEVNDDLPLGNRIINIRQASKGKTRIAITDEEIKEAEEIGIIPVIYAAKIGEATFDVSTQKCDEAQEILSRDLKQKNNSIGENE